MGVPFAELIGDPVAHSKSPVIHGFWLETLGMAGEYRRTRIPSGGLRTFFKDRMADPFWRGCSVTAPLKREAAELLGDPTGVCSWLGAVNCVFHSPLAPVPANTDLAGISEALAGTDVKGRKFCLIGAGGAAAAALCWLVREQAGEIAILSRDPRRAEAMARLVPNSAAPSLHAANLDQPGDAMVGAALIIHATPMGMAGGPPMGTNLIESVRKAATPDMRVFDMVYTPAETDLLAAARAAGARCVSGLDMLIGQAAPAFELFFGAPAPRERDAELRERLAR